MARNIRVPIRVDGWNAAFANISDIELVLPLVLARFLEVAELCISFSPSLALRFFLQK
jgi:hypothetical protein